MIISAVQFRPELGDKESNLSLIFNYSKKINSDLIVFPELATSGYLLTSDELSSIAEPLEGDTVRKIQEISTQNNKIIVFGFPEKYQDKYYNSAALVFPDSKLTSIYRKTHLFYKERFIFAEGNTGFRNIYYPDFDLNLGTMICYDWRFPEAARTLGLQGTDLIVVPSNLVTKIWHRAMPARALDNHVYLLVSNRIGSESRLDDDLVFNGQSAIWDYNGRKLESASEFEPTIITAEIVPSEARNKQINNINNIFSDRRIKSYQLETIKDK